MIYVKENYNNYVYLVEVSDNYVCLSNSSSVNGDWQNPDTIDVIYQYINAPLTVIESERSFNNTQNFTRIETSQDFFESPVYPYYASSILIVVMFIIYIINAITKIAKKGGIFFGS